MTTTPEAKAEDLAPIDPNLADAGKTEEDIWNELAADEKTAASAPEGDDGPGDQPEARDNVAAAPEAGNARPAQSAAPDIWANAPPELKAAYEAERSAREKAEKERTAAVGRVAPIQRKLDELRRAAEPRTATDKVKDAREALRPHEDEYPEIAKPVAQALDAIAERETAEDTSRRQAAVNELAEMERTATEALAQKHPDWQSFLEKHGGDQFAAWVEDQPRRIREAAYRNGKAILDAEGAIALIDAYKAHVAATSAPQPSAPAATTQPHPPTSLNEKRQRQLAATAAPNRAGGRPVVSGIPEEGDPQAIWDAFEAQERQHARA